QTLTPFIEIDALNRALDRYQDALLTHYGQRMRQKLGFFTEQNNAAAPLYSLRGLPLIGWRDMSHALNYLFADGQLKQGTLVAI
ncbi:hypothetical protein MJN54_35225, partial [Salmonella enterica subsp. enterica serovar Kentucky]|nr:hypothetical protein [Salmonella enterica subsp. enterica serovar Kentucky]